MRTLAALALVLLLAPAALADPTGPEPRTDDQKTLYTLGFLLSRNLGAFTLTAAEWEMVRAGLDDGVLNRAPRVDPQAYGPRVQDLQRTRLAAVTEAERKAGQAYLDRAAKEKGATRTAAGLIVIPIKAGTGPSPKATDKVKVHYHGTLTDGTVFDSSVQRGEPVVFPLSGVIRCWTEGLQAMKTGGKSRLVCPADLAYGDRGAPPRIKPGATLVFEVELLEIVR